MERYRIDVMLKDTGGVKFNHDILADIKNRALKSEIVGEANLVSPDSVEIIAEAASKEALEQFHDWLRSGASFSGSTTVDHIHWLPGKGVHSTFFIE